MPAIIKRTETFTETELDDEIVVMKLDSGEFLSVSGSGNSIWRLIDGERNREALLAALAAEFAVTPAQIAADVDEFLDLLRSEGLIADA